MYNNEQIEERNLAIATYNLNYEFLKTFIFNFYENNISEEKVSFKKCIELLRENNLITQQELEEIRNFSRKKVYFCRFIDKNKSNLEILEIEKYADYLQSFLDVLIENINSKFNLNNDVHNLLEDNYGY